MPSLSYQEKSLYGQLAVESVVYAVYFLFHRDNTVGAVVGMIVSIIALQVALQTMIAVATRDRRRDERDRLIELRGYRAGYVTLVALMFTGLSALWLHTALGQIRLDSRWMGPHLLSAFFGVLIISDMVKTATQLVAYRRSL